MLVELSVIVSVIVGTLLVAYTRLVSAVVPGVVLAWPLRPLNSKREYCLGYHHCLSSPHSSSSADDAPWASSSLVAPSPSAFLSESDLCSASAVTSP